MAATITSISHYTGTWAGHFHPFINMIGLGNLSDEYRYRYLVDGVLGYAFSGNWDGEATRQIMYFVDPYHSGPVKDVEYLVSIEEQYDGGAWVQVDTETFEIKQPGAPTLSSPANGASLTSWNDTLSWSSGGNTTEYFLKVGGYQALTGGYPSGNYLYYPSDPLPWDATSYTLTTENIYYAVNDFDQWFDPYYNSTHSWSVIATNEWCNTVTGAGTGGTESATWTFSIRGFHPPGPIYEDPGGGGTWTPIPDNDGDYPDGPDLPDDPLTYELVDYPNFIRTNKRLVAASGHQIWFETT